MIRSTISSRLIAMLSACRTRLSANGLASSAPPSLAVVMGASSATVLTWMKTTRPEGVVQTSIPSSASSRAASSGGTKSIMSTSPACSAATRAASLDMSFRTTRSKAGASPQ